MSDREMSSPNAQVSAMLFVSIGGLTITFLLVAFNAVVRIGISPILIVGIATIVCAVLAAIRNARKGYGYGVELMLAVGTLGVVILHL